MELALAIISIVVISVVYINYRFIKSLNEINKSLYETQERVDDKTYLTKDTKWIK